MRVLARIMFILGGLCAIMGIVNAALVRPLIVAGFDDTFWFSLAVILLLAAIFAFLAQGGE